MVEQNVTYGCRTAKLASTLGVAASRGEDLYNSFFEGNVSLSILKSRVESYWSEEGESFYIRAIDGRRVRTRSKHSLVNTLFQSCGAIIMDYSALILAASLGGLTTDQNGLPCFKYKGRTVRRVAYMHDEFVFDLPEDIVEEVAELARQSVVKAGEYLKLRVPLDADTAIGPTWADIH